MRPDQFRRVKELFDRLIDQPATVRNEILTEVRREDPSICDKVEELLEHGETEVAGATVGPTEPGANGAAGKGDRIGPYRLLQKVGEGGMGEVWEAEQVSPIRRRVALKIIKRGMDTAQVVARFEAERQALAMMDHPAVAKVFDAGQTPGGRPFFAMEYVRGVPITEHCDRHKLATVDRLRLLVQVCEGMQHSHQKAIIHRDLKPSNVLVSVIDGAAHAKIIDFGVAKATSQRLTERTLFTELGVLIGTPEYMSPEQAEMTGQDIDTRTDVYSLGVILYELLVGSLPFESKELRAAGIDAIRAKIREADPPLPSTRLSTLGDERSTESARRRRVDPRTLQRLIKGDLDWITMKSMEKDRTRRYSSMQEFAADIHRFLEDEPVLASPPSTAYLARKFVKRHRFGVLASSIALVGLLLGLAGTSFGLHRARIEAAKARQLAAFSQEFLTAVDPNIAGELDTRLLTLILERAADQIGAELRDQEVEASIRKMIGTTYLALGEYDNADLYLTQSLRIRREILGDSHRDTLSVRDDVGRLRRRQGRLEDAKQIHADVLTIRRKTLGNRHTDVGTSLNNVGAVARDLGNREEARESVAAAFEVLENTLGPEHPSVATTLKNLGDLERLSGDLDAAERHIERSLTIRKKQFGDASPDVAYSKSSLAKVYEEQAKSQTDPQRRELLVRARDLHKDALSIRETVLPENHRRIGNGHYFLGKGLVELEQYEEAGDHFRRALTIYQNAVAPNDSSIAFCTKRLAETELALGQDALAIDHFRQAYETFLRSGNADFKDHAEVLEGQAQALRRMGRVDEASALDTQARELRAQTD